MVQVSVTAVFNDSPNWVSPYNEIPINPRVI